jgi:hypothetical protein
MSIWRSLGAPNDFDHEDDCAYYTHRDGTLTPSGRKCTCGQPNAPLKYHGSHVFPQTHGDHGGDVGVAYIPAHVRYYRENPDGDRKKEPNHPVEPYLRLNVNQEVVVLTREQTKLLFDSLIWFLNNSQK